MKLKAVSACISMALSGFLVASPTNQNISEINVVGQSSSDAGVSVVSRNDLDQAQAHDLKSAVRYQAGVSVIGNSRSVGSFNIRGIDSNRVGMKIDGMTMPSGFYNWGHAKVKTPRDGVEMDTIKQMDVLKGADALVQDSDDFGGSINMRTYDPSDFVSSEKPYAAGVKANYHSENKDRSTTVHGAAQMGQAAALLMFTYGQNEEMETQGTQAGTGPARTTANPMKANRYNVLGKFTFGENDHRFRLTAEHYQRKTDTDNLSNLGPIVRRGKITGNRVSDVRKDSMERSRFALGYTWYNMPGWLETFSADLTHQRSKYTDETLQVSAPDKFTYNGEVLKQNTTALDTKLRGKIDGSFMDHSITLAAKYQIDETERTETSKVGTVKNVNKNTPDAKITQISVSLMDKMDFHNGLSITPALRFEHYKIKSKPDALYLNTLNPQWIPEYKESNVSPSLRIDYKINPQIHTWLSYARGVKNPPFEFLSGLMHPPFPPYTVVKFYANPNLKKETSDNFDFGVRYKGEKADVQLNLFYANYKNFIKLFSDTVSARPPVMELMTGNIDQVRTWGGEITGSYNFTDSFYGKTAISWMQASQKHQGKKSIFSGKQPTKVLLGLGYKGDIWGASTDLTLVEKQRHAPDVRGVEGFKTAGYALLDMGVWFKPAKNVTINAAVNNILDTKYYNTLDVATLNGKKPSESMTQPGRNFSLGLNVSF